MRPYLPPESRTKGVPNNQLPMSEPLSSIRPPHGMASLMRPSNNAANYNLLYVPSDAVVYVPNQIDRSSAPLTAEAIQNLLHQLQLAIEQGHIHAAQTTAGKLARQQVKTEMRVLQPGEDLQPDFRESQEISADSRQQLVKIIVEDIAGTSDTPLLLRLPLSMNIHQLKRKFFTEYHFPISSQQWIVGNRLSVDDETLLQLLGSDSTPGQVIFLYLQGASANSNGPEVAQEAFYTVAVETGATASTNVAAPIADDDFVLVPVASNGTGAVQEVEVTNEVTELNPQHREIEATQEGWVCTTCTLINRPSRPACEICGADRPDDYLVPVNTVYYAEEQARIQAETVHMQQLAAFEEEERQLRLDSYIAAEAAPVLVNRQPFECAICCDDVDVGDGVTLRDCLHQFCKECIREHCEQSETPEVLCPHQDDVFSCESKITEREIRELLSDAAFQKHLERSLRTAEAGMNNAFHCTTANCRGWCEIVDEVNFFVCEICRTKNCLTCRAGHPDQTCKEYQDDLRVKAANDVSSQKTMEALDLMIKKNEAMHCPQCKVVLQKKEGCDWLRCSMCRTEICWVTRGPRWGPAGSGDTSAGCRCRVNGVLCHPKCGNCH